MILKVAPIPWFYIFNSGFDPAFKLFDQNISAGVLTKKKKKFSSYKEMRKRGR
jgi:hypothetical protein